VCIAFSLARLSQLGGDGIQANVEREFGATPAYLVTWAFWVSNWVSQAAVGIAGASALSWVSPAFAGSGFVVAVAIASVVLLTAVNAIGVRASGGMSMITVAIKLVPLAAVILILGIRAAGTHPYEPLAPAPVTLANVATAVALTFFAMTGFESATTLVNKARNPTRTVPLAILGGTIFVALIYLLASTGVQFLLPASVVAVSPAPFAEVVTSQWGAGAASLAALAIAVAAFGCLNGLILGSGELGYSMALRRDLPGFMTRTRGVNTPVNSQVVSSALTILLILANSSRNTANLFTFIILLSTAAVLVVYFTGALAAWRLSSSLSARSAVIIALLFTLFALYGSGAEADLWCLVLLAIGLAVRAVMHRLNSRATIPVLEVAPAAPVE
jgi:APA family basic amino acid/polyamine antiporter